MTVALALVQLISMALCAYFEYRVGSVSVFLWATLLVMFGLPHFVSVLFGIHDYSSTVMGDASQFVLMFNILYLFGRLLLLGIASRRATAHKPVSSRSDQLASRMMLFALVFSIGSIVGVAVRELGGILGTSWGGFYSLKGSPYAFGLNASLVQSISMFLLFAFGGVANLFLEMKKPILAALAVSTSLTYATITRNKITVLPAFVSLIWYYIARHRRVRVREAVTVTIVVVVVIYAVYALQVFRYAGTTRDFLASYDFSMFNRRVIEMILEGQGEIGLRNAFYYFMANDNRFPGFGEGHTYIRLLMILIPTRFSLGLKPPDFAITMGSAYSGDYSNQTYSMHPTLYGDCYANFAWAGILLGLFWAFFVTVADVVRHRRSVCCTEALTVLSGCVFVIIGRGSVYNGSFIGLVSSAMIGALWMMARMLTSVRFAHDRSGRAQLRTHARGSREA